MKSIITSLESTFYNNTESVSGRSLLRHNSVTLKIKLFRNQRDNQKNEMVLIETRRFRVDSQISFKQLKNLIKSLFGNEEFKITYIDNDNDSISVKSDADWLEAKSLFVEYFPDKPIIRLMIGEKQTTDIIVENYGVQ